MSMPICSAIAKSGRPCVVPAIDATGRCAGHHEDAEVKRRVLSARGKAGQAAQARAKASVQRKACTIRSIDDVLGEVERTILSVHNSSGQAVQKAKAISGLLSLALDALRTGTIETNNRELRKVLLERHPDLARQLKAVP